MADTGKRLVLEIELPADFYVDGHETDVLDEFGGTLLDIVTDEWMREDVGLTFVSQPGEKCMTSEFEVHAMVGRIVGARIADSDGSAA